MKSVRFGVEPPAKDGYGYVYVLSTRGQPRMLRIGYTDRAVERRVSEINPATGVLVPYGARSVWKVRAARDVETLVYQAFAPQRVRADRELFDMDFREAARVIGDLIRARRIAEA